MAIFQGKTTVQSKKSDIASNRNHLHTFSSLPDCVVISAPKMSAVKPKRTQYTVAEKLKIITREPGASVQGIKVSTIRGWLKEETNLRSFFDEIDTNAGLLKKCAKTSQNPDVDTVLYSRAATNSRIFELK